MISKFGLFNPNTNVTMAVVHARNRLLTGNGKPFVEIPKDLLPTTPGTGGPIAILNPA